MPSLMQNRLDHMLFVLQLRLNLTLPSHPKTLRPCGGAAIFYSAADVAFDSYAVFAVVVKVSNSPLVSHMDRKEPPSFRTRS